MAGKNKDLELVASWRASAYKFVVECIGAEPTPQQKEALDIASALAQAKLKASLKAELTPEEKALSEKLGIAIKSGHGTGKDTWLSWVYLWLETCYPFARGMVTAPTSHQLSSALWGEFKKWIRFSGDKVRERTGDYKAKSLLELNIMWQSDKIFMKDHKEEWFVEARTANVKGTDEEQGETLAGRHANYMILAVDESSGVPKGVFKPIEGAMTGQMNFAIQIGNPTRSSGYFFESFNVNKKDWICLTWNSEESPNVPEHIWKAEKEKYGYDSNWYRIRRRGEFPLTADNTLIPYEWVMRAVERYENQEFEISEDTPTRKAIDPGNGGDKTILLTKQGPIVSDIKETDSPDTMQVAAWAMMELLDEEDYTTVSIDPIGIGAGIYDRMKEQKIKKLHAVDVRCNANQDRFFRLRDELYWLMREDFEAGTIAIPRDDELIDELSNIRYETPDSTKGKIKVESKKDLKKRGLHSPNKADALMQTYVFKHLTPKVVKKAKDPYEMSKKRTYTWMGR